MKTYKTLDEVMEQINSPDFDNILSTYFLNSKRTRESTKEILDAISSYDILLLYMELFDNRLPFLIEAEMEWLKKKFKNTFDEQLWVLIDSV